MPASRQQIEAAAPRFNNPRRNWSGLCEAAAWNLANVLSPGSVRSFSDATSARRASKIEGPGLGPGGNWVWMSGVWGTQGGRRVDFGHVAYHVGGGLLFMASSSVDSIRGFTNLGFIDGNAYLRRFPNQKLEGWSYDHGGTIIPGDGPIVVPVPRPTPAPAPLPPELPQEEEMIHILREKTGVTYAIAPEFIKSIADGRTNEMLQKALGLQGKAVPGFNDDDFERVLNSFGVPLDIFLDQVDDGLIRGWSRARGHWAEAPFGVLSRS